LTKHRLPLLALLLFAVSYGLFPATQSVAERFCLARADAHERTTAVPATAVPDQLCMTWSGDPATTQTVQWRTSPAVAQSAVQYRLSGGDAGEVTEVKAGLQVLEDPLLVNDPANHRFTATITELTPNTAYIYRVGNPAANVWTEWTEFTTAPLDAGPFSFAYLGDAQLGYEEWGRLLHRAAEQRPGPAFYLMAGDLANRGNDREDWDALFHAAQGVYNRRPVMPAIGNHEYTREENPRLFLDMFTLPKNGPAGIPPERTYRFAYRNALFLVLDSNQPADAQRAWLAEQLAASNATWNFALFHHPVYSSAPRRDNPEIREHWGAVFDEYHVDMVFTGHDHAYLRTPPMRAGQAVASAAQGTYYVVANSGLKHYEQESHEYAAVAFTDIPTYQLIDIETSGGNTLTYRAYDANGNVRDEVIIEK